MFPLKQNKSSFQQKAINQIPNSVHVTLHCQPLLFLCVLLACVFGSLTPTGLSGSTVHWAWALVVNHHTKPLRLPLPAQTPTSSTSSSRSKDRQAQRSVYQAETPRCHPHG